MGNSVTVAACQLPEIREDIPASVRLVLEHATRSEAAGADLVVFPECCLQGYLLNHEPASQHALSLSSRRFDQIRETLSAVRPILVVGLIEAEGQKLFNTAVVLDQGKMVGRYRKTRLLPAEDIFDPGTEYPVFTVRDLRFGINVCNDLNFPECAQAVSRQDAQLLVCPCNNMLPTETAEKWKHKHTPARARRAIESGLWLISSDVTGERDGSVSYGPTEAISPGGEVVSRLPLGEVGMMVQTIG